MGSLFFAAIATILAVSSYHLGKNMERLKNFRTVSDLIIEISDRNIAQFRKTAESIGKTKDPKEISKVLMMHERSNESLKIAHEVIDSFGKGVVKSEGNNKN